MLSDNAAMLKVFETSGLGIRIRRETAPSMSHFNSDEPE